MRLFVWNTYANYPLRTSEFVIVRSSRLLALHEILLYFMYTGQCWIYERQYLEYIWDHYDHTLIAWGKGIRIIMVNYLSNIMMFL